MSDSICSLFTDGGARGNPGPAAIGGLLTLTSGEVREFSEYIGSTTNNQAEYRALLFGLELARSNGVQKINCYLDSELVVKQLNGIYKVKNAEIKPVFEKVQTLTNDFDLITFNHVPREKNKQADALVNRALDRATTSLA